MFILSHIGSIFTFLYKTLFLLNLAKHTTNDEETKFMHIETQTDSSLVTPEQQSLQQQVEALSEQIQMLSQSSQTEIERLNLENQTLNNTVAQLKLEKEDLAKRHEILDLKLQQTRTKSTEMQKQLLWSFENVKELQGFIDQQTKELEELKITNRNQSMEISVLQRQLEFSRQANALSSCTSITTLSRPQSPIGSEFDGHNSPLSTTYSDYESEPGYSPVRSGSPLCDITNTTTSERPVTPLRKKRSRNSTPNLLQRTFAL
jgi:hypothetical protein